MQVRDAGAIEALRQEEAHVVENVECPYNRDGNAFQANELWRPLAYGSSPLNNGSPVPQGENAASTHNDKLEQFVCSVCDSKRHILHGVERSGERVGQEAADGARDDVAIALWVGSAQYHCERRVAAEEKVVLLQLGAFVLEGPDVHDPAGDGGHASQREVDNLHAQVRVRVVRGQRAHAAVLRLREAVVARRVRDVRHAARRLQSEYCSKGPPAGRIEGPIP
ncbi:unnamed protein product [Phytophthora lilii]|uniref:Unnamed protein product n=1 Tax=Phytophthora lilii TaxID=2077276 RepID=A0A9W6WGQ8_9STRA|nr:unnamed protein product [Phytophthora lilii]